MNRRRHNQYSLSEIAQNAVIEYGFTPFYSQAALHQVKRLQESVSNKKDGIKDLRNLFWTSIDNDDSQDLDQLEYCERRPQAMIHVKIAVADVDHYVARGDVIDRHASHNATSLYTGVENFPMLPQELSYHLSSLLPDCDRLAIVVEYNVQKDGQIQYGDVYRAWVRNKAKLVYEEVGQWLDDPKSVKPDWLTPEIKYQLPLQYEAAYKLRGWRQKQGMLEFETIESKPLIIEGVIRDLIVRATCKAHKIIEQFMVAANQTTINFLTSRNIPTIQRIVRNPERWGRIVEIAQSFDFELPSEPDSAALRQFLVTRYRKKPDTFADLSLMLIKLIGRGEYEIVNPGRQGHGHFGLAVGHYTHSTAPNRRYVDLIIQRLVKNALEKQPPPYTKRELVELAAWCTERDAASKKVERFVRKVAAALLLQNEVGHDFEGIITGASNKGVYVRLLKPPAEGRIMRGEQGLDVGQKVIVRLTHADPLKGFLDFQRIKVLHG